MPNIRPVRTSKFSYSIYLPEQLHSGFFGLGGDMGVLGMAAQATESG